MTDTTDAAGSGPLAGIRVLDLGILVQGPQAAQFLYELGAEVVKIEQPGIGDHARWLPLDLEGRDWRPPFFIGCNRGKRSMTLDLRTPAGRDLLLDLVEVSDVLISNFSAGTMDELGVGHEACAARNPRLVYAAGTAYGHEGPTAARKGADIGGQAAGGLSRALGTDQPAAVGVTIADHIASQNMVAGILAALYARERTGRGQRIETSLLGGQIYAQATEYTATSLTGRDLPSASHGGHPLINGLYGVVPTADGALALVGITPPFRVGFYTALGAPELADDERFMEAGLVPAVRDELLGRIVEITATRTTAEWGERFDAADIRWAPVRHRSETLADPEAHADGYLYHDEHPEWGEVVMVGTPVRFSDTPARHGGPVPELGQHTEEILLELGRDWEEISRLREAGAF